MATHELYIFRFSIFRTHSFPQVLPSINYLTSKSQTVTILPTIGILAGYLSPVEDISLWQGFVCPMALLQLLPRRVFSTRLIEEDHF